MIRTIVALLLFCAAHAAFAFDPFSIDRLRGPTNDEEGVAFTLMYAHDPLEYHMGYFAEKLGTERLAELILGFVEPIIDEASVSADSSMKSQLCGSGIYAMGLIGATNALPFLEKTVLRGGKFSQNAFVAYGRITQYGKPCIDLGDQAVEKGALNGGYYRDRLNFILWKDSVGELQITFESKLRIAAHIIGVPSGHWGTIKINDDMFLADFPFYTNSVERLKALSVLVDNAFTPPEVRTKYELERDRLKALPPEELVCATDVLNAQLDALLKAAERKKAIARIRRIAVPAVAVILFVTGLVFIRKNVLVRKRNSVGHV